MKQHTSALEDRCPFARRAALVVLIVTCLMLGAVPCEATTANANYERRTEEYCFESVPPNISGYEGSSFALAEYQWERSQRDVYGALAFDLELVSCGPGVIRIKTFYEDSGVVGSYGGSFIGFNTKFSFWPTGDGKPPGYYSYVGILVHEMGHSVGAEHTGNQDWSYDTGGGQSPSMASGTGPPDSVWQESLAQDDRGTSQWIITLADWYPIFSTNPSWEGPYPGDWGAWGSGGTRSTLHYLDGSYSLRVTSGNGVSTTSVYDPFFDVGQGVVPGMAAGVTLYARTRHREHTGEVGKVQVCYAYSEMKYHSSSSKVYGGDLYDEDLSGWFCTTCSSTTSWTLCDSTRSFVLVSQFNEWNNTVVWRVRFMGAGTGTTTYLERTGAWADVTP
jgi:hypothetical protein